MEMEIKIKRKKNGEKRREEKEWQEPGEEGVREISKLAANTVRNKKAMIIAFLFRCFKTAYAAHTQFYIQGE